MLVRLGQQRAQNLQQQQDCQHAHATGACRASTNVFEGVLERRNGLHVQTQLALGGGIVRSLQAKSTVSKPAKSASLPPRVTC